MNPTRVIRCYVYGRLMGDPWPWWGTKVPEWWRTRVARRGFSSVRRLTLNDALRRLLRPAPTPTLQTWALQMGQCWLGTQAAPTPPPSVGLCGHDMSLDAALTPDGGCRACLNAAIIRGAA